MKPTRPSLSLTVLIALAASGLAHAAPEGQVQEATPLAPVDLTLPSSPLLASPPEAAASTTDGALPADVPVAAPAPRPRSAPAGTATRALLRLQASGDAGAPPRPMLGATATAAYQRYLASFSHAIPEFFDTNVESAGSGK